MKQLSSSQIGYVTFSAIDFREFVCIFFELIDDHLASIGSV